ncbi:MAG: GNAT family N-acetyltransferase [Proteobacteria bacterium]|nr:GNAT family N-acetyltransferase [Pseudomonadota bacterium]
MVQALAHAIWPIAYASILRPEQVQNMLERIYALENLQAEMQSGHRFFIAWEGFEPLGYASAYKEGDTVWVKKLYVQPDRQGEGIGSQLMQAAVSALSPAREVSLLVNSNNTPAMTYYERSGFSRSGETPVQMGDYHFTDYIYTAPATRIIKA